MSKKRYFDNEDEGSCYGLSYFKELLKETGENEMRLWEGVIELGVDHFWCAEYEEAGLKSESECGSGCEGYSPRNGKNGRCKHSKNCYFPCDEYILKLEGKKFTLKKVEAA